MTLLKFSTKNLINFQAYKDKNSVYVNLYYSDLDELYSIREIVDTSTIFFYSFTQINKLGWVTFYKSSEILGLSVDEKKLYGKIKTKENLNKENNINLLDKDLDLDLDLDLESICLKF